MDRWKVEVLGHVNITYDVEAETEDAACARAEEMMRAALSESPAVDREDVVLVEANQVAPSPPMP